MTRAPVLSWMAGALCLALTASACEDDNHPDLPCDIRKEPCQRAVWYATSLVRNQPQGKMPKIRVISRAQYADETRKATQAQRDRETEPNWSGEIIEAAYRLVAFLPEDVSDSDARDASNITGVAAYYSTRTRDVTVIERENASAANDTYTLSHEFTHALQDQRNDLAPLDAQRLRSSDTNLAISSLVEGEAVAISNAVLNLTYSQRPLANTAFYDGMLAEFLGRIAASEAPWTEAGFTLPYPVGGRALTTAYLERGYPAIEERFGTHPLTYAGWVEGGAVDALPLPLQCSVVDAPSGYQHMYNDRLGGAALLALYTRLGLSGDEAFQAARAWTNDLFTIYAPMNERGPALAVVAWRIGLNSAEAIAYLTDKVAASKLAIDVQQREREVLLTAATDPSVLTGWAARDACVTPKGARAADDVPTASLLPPSDVLRSPGHAARRIAR